MSDFRVEFPSDSSVHGLGLLLDRSYVPAGSNYDRLTFSLEKVRKFTPFTACYLVALIDELAGRFKRGTIVPPIDENARHQVEYLGIKSHFGGTPLKTSRAVAAVPLVQLKAADYDVPFRMAGLVRDSFKLPDALFYLVQLCLKEFLQNAFEHAESAAGVYACAYGIGTKRIVGLCTLDKGIGVRAHLTRNPKYRHIATDSEALLRIAQKGVTGQRDASRGHGLYYVRRLIEGIGGELVISSGDSQVIHQPPEDPKTNTLQGHFRGTIVNITFRAKASYRFNLNDIEG